MVLTILLIVLFIGQTYSDRAGQHATIETRLAEQAETMDIAMLNARRHEKDFMLRKDKIYVRQHADSVQIAQKALDAMERDDAAGSEQIVGIRKGVAAYADIFRSLAERQVMVGLNENDGQMASLRGSVHEIETILSAHDDLRLTVLMLMMRRHEKDFLARLDPHYVEQLEQRVVEFEKALRSSAISPQDRQAILDRLARYDQDFKVIAEGTLAIAADSKALSASYAAIEPAIRSRVDDAHEAMNVAKQDARRIDALYSRAMTMVMVFGFAVMAIVGTMIARGVVQPIKGMTATMTQLSRGDDSIEIPATDRRDEIGEMGRAVQIFKETAIERRLMAEREKADLLIREVRHRAVDEATTRFDGTVGALLSRIKSAVEHMHVSSDSLSANAEQTMQQSTAVAAATDQATANVETVSAAGTELTASIHEISRQVQQSAEISRSAADEVLEANRQIGGLAEAAQKIGDVVSLINTIASQTNLLALNATIESARAGVAGKGFAVVANEVKHLAGQTGRATDDITQQVTLVQEETHAAVAAIGSISGTIAQISQMATAIAGAVEEQGAATAEIARNVEQASQGTREIANNISGVAQAAAETGRMARDLFEAANQLLNESQILEQAVVHFLREVREV